MKYALSIAGFDPSSGAGMTADLKTFEAFQVYGLLACTAVTVQNDEQFTSLKWLDDDLIGDQIHILMKRYPVRFVKVGLIRDMDQLLKIGEWIRSFGKDILIIWDPIMKASAGFDFHPDFNDEKLKEALQYCYLITPNREEWKLAFAKMVTTEVWSDLGNVLLKGGHDNGDKSKDLLFDKEGILELKSDRLPYGKHGSGCVLSAAITANLALGKNLRESCLEAKKYITKFLLSSNSKTGIHSYG